MAKRRRCRPRSAKLACRPGPSRRRLISSACSASRNDCRTPAAPSWVRPRPSEVVASPVARRALAAHQLREPVDGIDGSVRLGHHHDADGVLVGGDQRPDLASRDHVLGGAQRSASPRRPMDIAPRSAITATCFERSAPSRRARSSATRSDEYDPVSSEAMKSPSSLSRVSVTARSRSNSMAHADAALRHREAGDLIEALLLADHADEAADTIAHRDRAHQRGEAVAPDRELADRRIGADRSDGPAPAA